MTFDLVGARIEGVWFAPAGTPVPTSTAEPLPAGFDSSPPDSPLGKPVAVVVDLTRGGAAGRLILPAVLLHDGSAGWSARMCRTEGWPDGSKARIGHCGRPVDAGRR